MITVRTCKSNEIKDYKESKYNLFLKYYFETNIPVTVILEDVLGLNKTNSTARYIRKQLRKDGYNSLKRWQSIKRGEWVK